MLCCKCCGYVYMLSQKSEISNRERVLVNVHVTYTSTHTHAHTRETTIDKCNNSRIVRLFLSFSWICCNRSGRKCDEHKNGYQISMLEFFWGGERCGWGCFDSHTVSILITILSSWRISSFTEISKCENSKTKLLTQFCHKIHSTHALAAVVYFVYTFCIELQIVVVLNLELNFIYMPK